MSTTTNLSTLKINYLTQAQYDAALANSEINENEIYLTPDSGSGGITAETDPVFTASPAYGITANDISGWNGKSDFSGSYNDLSDKPTIPSYSNATQSQAGLMSASDKQKLDALLTITQDAQTGEVTIGTGASQNQNGEVTI